MENTVTHDFRRGFDLPPTFALINAAIPSSIIARAGSRKQAERMRKKIARRNHAPVIQIDIVKVSR